MSQVLEASADSKELGTALLVRLILLANPLIRRPYNPYGAASF